MADEAPDTPSKEALKALTQYRERDTASPELLSTLERHGLLWPVEHPGHEALQVRMFATYARADRQHVADNFILGVQENRSDLRAGLSAYAFMVHFPRHQEQPHPSLACAVCGQVREGRFDPTTWARVRHNIGVVLGGSVNAITFLLEQHNLTPRRAPGDMSTLVALLRLLHHESDAKDTPSTIVKRVRALPGLKLSVEQARHLLDALGHAGLLQTPEHPGLAQRFTRVGLAPRTSRSSDWSYPVDFWKGAYGIDSGALRFWFAHHPALLAALD